MLKKITSILIFSVLAVPVFGQSAYEITIKTKLKDGDTLILANYFGDKQYAKDTAYAINNKAVFSGKKPLANGVYLVVMPQKNYFEILVPNEDQRFELEVPEDLNPKDIMVKGSKDNALFLAFGAFAQEQGLLAREIREAFNTAKNEKEKKELREKNTQLANAVTQKRIELARANPNTFAAKLFMSMTDIDIPDAPEDLGKEGKKEWTFNYYKKHYWDNIDLSEDGLVRTPVFYNKLKYYIQKVYPQIPDSVIAGADRLIGKIDEQKAPELFHFAVWWLTNTYEENKTVCMDKMLHYMASTYYCAGRAWWADSSTVAKFCEHAKNIGPTLCDKQAPEMLMPDTNKNLQSLHAVMADYTVVAFWDHECGHCKKEIPKLSRIYKDSLQNLGVKVYAVYTQGDWDGWKKFVQEKEISFINVANMYGMDNFRENYNIISTPKFLILDKNKIIKLKDVPIDKIYEAIQFLIKDEKNQN